MHGKKTCLIVLVVSVCVLRPVYLQAQIGGESDPQQMLDFTLSGYGTGGQKTWEVDGASMDILDHKITISDFTAKLYGDEEDMVLTAEEGVFDKESGVMHLKKNVRAVTDGGVQMDTQTLDWSQKEQLITSQDHVEFRRESMKATATGLEAQPDFKVATLEKDVIVTIESQKQQLPGEGRSENGEMKQMVITCDGSMELNYAEEKAIFYDNVKVEGDAQQGQMYADKMTIYFSSGNKQLDRMEAEGNVRIVRGDNTSYSDGAVFTGSDQNLVLTGRPKLVIFTEEDFNVSP